MNNRAHVPKLDIYTGGAFKAGLGWIAEDTEHIKLNLREATNKEMDV